MNLKIETFRSKAIAGGKLLVTVCNDKRLGYDDGYKELVLAYAGDGYFLGYVTDGFRYLEDIFFHGTLKEAIKANTKFL